jgi:hypothetical protein
MRGIPRGAGQMGVFQQPARIETSMWKKRKALQTEEFEGPSQNCPSFISKRMIKFL